MIRDSITRTPDLPAAPALDTNNRHTEGCGGPQPRPVVGILPPCLTYRLRDVQFVDLFAWEEPVRHSMMAALLPAGRHSASFPLILIRARVSSSTKASPQWPR